MTEEKNSLRYKTRHEHNPYIGLKLDITLNNNKREKEKVINFPNKLYGNTSDLNINSVSHYTLVDTEKFIKIYAETAGLWLNLSRPAQKVFSFIISHLERNKDTVMIDMAELSEHTGYTSQGPLYEAINELINKQLLARTTSDIIYYINPSFIFNGDRLLLGELIEKMPDHDISEGELLDDWL